MKQINPEATPPVYYTTVHPSNNSILQNISLSVPRSFFRDVYDQALLGQQEQIQPQNMLQQTASLSYIEQIYHNHILDQTQEFLFKFFVVNTLYKEIREKKLVLAGTPRIIDIATNDSGDTIFNFTATILPKFDIPEWKYLPFKTPRRKRYKDLDRQVEFFIAEEEQQKENLSSEKIAIDDWINFDVFLVNKKQEILLNNYAENLWLKIGNEEADTDFQELFIGKRVGDKLFTNSSALQEFFNEETDSNFNFCVIINDIVPNSFVCLEEIKKQFRIKTNKELHQKLIEVFSYRNDISQHKSIVDESCRLLLAKQSYEAPKALVLRQEEEILDNIQTNPDYLVYKMQKDFRKTVSQLAERQVKETILMDQIACNEKIETTHEDIKNYLNLTKRQRTREFIHFELPSTKVRGQESPVITEELIRTCSREKTLNYIIYHLTKK